MRPNTAWISFWLAYLCLDTGIHRVLFFLQLDETLAKSRRNHWRLGERLHASTLDQDHCRMPCFFKSATMQASCRIHGFPFLFELVAD